MYDKYGMQFSLIESQCYLILTRLLKKMLDTYIRSTLIEEKLLGGNKVKLTFLKSHKIEESWHTIYLIISLI